MTFQALKLASRNILKDLHHENIVRYHDRYVDRDAGILYILMEYCGGGDLSSIIKQAQRHQRPIPEDTVWNYFMQLCLALSYCHHPNGQGQGRLSGGPDSADEKGKRAQILHRDLKPDNVFLDENNCVKLGDFGLSKALSQASFAQTYVGTPYYMSPELMQEKAYDSKSDIWSLGCLIFELCALKPPFAEAKTHAELSILIRNGRIPPLPKGYSPALSSVIKAMLNLNPAMRPSAAQLLQHERLDLAFKVAETQKMLNAVKVHKTNVVARERDIAAREATLVEKENTLTSLVAVKDAEITSLRALLATAEESHQAKIREALLKREEELRAMVLKHEADVAMRMARREEEIMESVRRREEEIAKMWADWERETREGMARAVEERMAWVETQTAELEKERDRLLSAHTELERRCEQAEKELAASRREGKTPLESVKNLMRQPLWDEETVQQTPLKSKPPIFETPIRANTADFSPPSAMKGVVLTATGQHLATPSPAEFAKLFMETPKVSLNFAQIFDFESDTDDYDAEGYETDTHVLQSLAATIRGRKRAQMHDSEPDEDDEDEDVERTPKQAVQPLVKPTGLRRPSIRASSSRSPIIESISAPSIPSSSSRPSSRPSSRASSSSATSTVSSSTVTARTRSRARPATGAGTRSTGFVPSRETPEYDISDEENLPSPFLKKIDRERIARTASVPALQHTMKSDAHVASALPRTRTANARKSGPSTLRAVAVVNAAQAVNGHGTTTNRSAGNAGARAPSRTASAAPTVHAGVRTSIQKARNASEDARKALAFRA
ncbi:uncharacterized protein PHACADRAFT_147201 [Phanerochaete carnosa HHB-10118-sp]|uniref:non-specific serine/threonine protein kinase n=1 Tax=Phanerochaete carnosa (strain HHB-10118-sp) TaxID=650164 RepID=K5W7H7_PHACS|nr:uncharacterized protein PHACADRAFT_147201 [Phanerochaete carnosa HHB-10118-sp]EKM54914.1 hypothetical protein PHACADRAFT_147201 [Phanerochaete carnosa HHB-10118-sp]